MPEQVGDQDELRDIRKAERGESFDRFVRGEPVEGFFQQEFVPLVERHFRAWLALVIAKQAGPEVLQVLQNLMKDFDERIKLGKMAAERITRRRFGKLPMGNQ